VIAMAFDPIEFYRLASAWYNANAKEATHRCVVSRAYYAALLAARDKAKITTTSASTHSDTYEYYRTKGGGVNKGIANRLDTLRGDRNNADYDVKQTCVSRNAGEALKTSKKILTDLGFTV
jgi:uncharacterized protein (UPF0332 family)